MDPNLKHDTPYYEGFDPNGIWFWVKGPKGPKEGISEESEIPLALENAMILVLMGWERTYHGWVCPAMGCLGLIGISQNGK